MATPFSSCTSYIKHAKSMAPRCTTLFCHTPHYNLSTTVTDYSNAQCLTAVSISSVLTLCANYYVTYHRLISLNLINHYTRYYLYFVTKFQCFQWTGITQKSAISYGLDDRGSTLSRGRHIYLRHYIRIGSGVSFCLFEMWGYPIAGKADGAHSWPFSTT
jgi:hypothetical protein